jgi:thymidylate synthase (FAD)
MSRVQKSDVLPPNAIQLFNNQGFVALIDHMGDDRTVVNAARVSFGKRIETFDPEKDSKLLDYLAEHKHMSPFRHPQISFHLKAPEAVMRQAYKHVVGIGWTPNECPIKDHAWNEISGRYVMYEDVYEPAMFRPQSEDNKQASEDGDLSQVEAPAIIGDSEFVEKYGKLLMYNVDGLNVRTLYQLSVDFSKKAYQALVDAGVAKEQARLVMPFSTFTEVIWTCSLEAVVHFVKLRTHAGAQWETREFAEAIQKLTEQHYPYSLEALLKHL